MAEDLGHLLLHPRGAREQRRDHGFIRDLAALPYSSAKLGNGREPVVRWAGHLETLGQGIVGSAQHAGMAGNFGVLGPVGGWTSTGHDDAPRFVRSKR
jgi:hypothetical protein